MLILKYVLWHHSFGSHFILYKATPDLYQITEIINVRYIVDPVDHGVVMA